MGDRVEFNDTAGSLFEDDYSPRFDVFHAIALDRQLAPEFQAGLTDAEGTLILPEPIELPHGRIFALRNSDRRLLGITRLSLVNAIRLEPNSVRIRLSSRRGRKHEIGGVMLINRKNNYLIEILSGAKRKWLERVGTKLQHPRSAHLPTDFLRLTDRTPCLSRDWNLGQSYRLHRFVWDMSGRRGNI